MPLPIALGSALLAGGTSLLGNVINSWWQRGESDRAFRKEKELLQYQNNYNKPWRQMYRLKKAGLNPNLVYGSGNVTGNLTGGLPKYQVPNVDLGIDNAISHGMNTYMTYKQGQQMDANIDQVNETAKLTYEKRLTEAYVRQGIATDNMIKAIDKNYRGELNKYQLEGYKNAAIKTAEDINTIRLKRPKELDIMEAELKEKKEKLALIGAQISNLKIDEKTKRRYYDRWVKDGVPPNSPPGWSLLLEIAKQLGITLSDAKEAIETAGKSEIIEKNKEAWNKAGRENEKRNKKLKKKWEELKRTR